MHLPLIYLSLIAVTTATLVTNRTLADLSYRVCGRKVNFPSQETKVLIRNAGKFIPRNILFTRCQFSGQNVFITEPRYKSGVALTLSKTVISRNDFDVELSAYPDWSSQEEGNCNSIQSAIDLFLDTNNILWVLDAGVRLNLETPDTKCPPKVLAISTNTNRIIRTIDLSPLTTDKSNLQYIAVENNSGDDYVYISDAGGKAIIVFNVGAGRGRRLVLPDAINCPDSQVLQLCLIRKDNSNHLYFTYSVCKTIYSITTAALISGESSTLINLRGKTNEPILFLGTNGQNKLYFRTVPKSDVYVWDTQNDLLPDDWNRVWSGEPERKASHVAKGPYNVDWILESNFENFVRNSTGCLGDCSKLSPIIGNVG